MALRILSSRLPSRPLTVGARNASSGGQLDPQQKKSEVSVGSTERKRRSESLLSILSSFVGGKIDPADPNAPKISARKVGFANPVDKATGEEKLFLLAFENGIADPYCNFPITRGDRGTKEKPVQVKSFYNKRHLSCVCEPSQNFHKVTMVYKGEPKRCQCGIWFELVDAPKFWMKIPKEDLLTIPYFKQLEEDGKFEDLMAGKINPFIDGEPAHH